MVQDSNWLVKSLSSSLKLSLNVYLLLGSLFADFLHHPKSRAVPQSLFPAGPVENTGQNESTSLVPMRRKHKEIREKI